MGKITVLDTTLRDGSYAINFTFSSALTGVLCKELEDSGVEYIEIGHGVGLGATRKNMHPAVESDESYLKAARSHLTTSKFGMFCIPGVADLTDLDIAAEHGMNFVRIGTDIDKVPQSEKFIEKAKKLGMFVAANYMKSYAADEKTFAKNVKLSESYGADAVYIVDSAGGMFWSDIKRYFEATKSCTDLLVGFHAHDNLGMAVSNSVEAAKAGFDLIDTSLQGMGRSSGNASTETFVAACDKLGIRHGLNLLKILKLGPKFIQPIWNRKGIMPLDVIAGLAEFHSSYMPQVLKCASEKSVDPAMLIIELCKVDKVNLDQKVLYRIADEISQSQAAKNIMEYGYSTYVGNEQVRG